MYALPDEWIRGEGFEKTGLTTTSFRGTLVLSRSRGAAGKSNPTNHAAPRLGVILSL
jgi:hypothetical protein